MHWLTILVGLLVIFSRLVADASKCGDINPRKLAGIVLLCWLFAEMPVRTVKMPMPHNFALNWSELNMPPLMNARNPTKEDLMLNANLFSVWQHMKIVLIVSMPREFYFKSNGSDSSHSTTACSWAMPLKMIKFLEAGTSKPRLLKWCFTAGVCSIAT